MMHVMFTEEELDAIDMEPFRWKVSGNPPKRVRESIRRKLALIERQQLQLNASLMENHDG